MMGIVSETLIRASLAGRVVSARVRWPSAASALVAVVLFKLALSDGGRHEPTLAFAQVTVFVITALLLLAGAVRGNIVTAAVGGMLVVTGGTALWSVRPDATVRLTLLWILYLSIAAITSSTLRSLRAVRWFVDAAVVIAGWLCLVALFVFWGAGDASMRWYSTFYWPNPFAGFLLLALPIQVFRYVHVPAREALAHGCLAGLLGVALVLTHSRGPWLSLLVVLPVAAIVLRPPSWPRAAGRGLVLGAGVVAVVVALTQGAVLGLGQNEKRAAAEAEARQLSIQGRLRFWRSAWAIFRDHPFGTGAGTFGAVHPAYQEDVRFYASDAHNLYLQTAAETGVPGLIALAGVLGTIAVVWRRTLRLARGTALYAIVAGTGVALLAFAVHSGMEMNWMFPANPAMAFALVGMLAAAERILVADGAPALRFRWRLAAAVLLCFASAAAMLGWSAQREYVRGQELVRAANWAAAAAAYGRAARWNPLQARYPATRATALMQTIPPQPEAAEAALRRAMAVDRMNASLPLQLARLLMEEPVDRVAAPAEAETLLRHSLALDPWNRPEAYRLLARLYLRQGRTEDADRVYLDAIARYTGRNLGRPSVIYLFLWPDVVKLFMDAADASTAHGDPIRAAQILEALLIEDPDVAPAIVRLSELYMTLGRREAARDLLEAAALRMPSHPRIAAALKALR